MVAMRKHSKRNRRVLSPRGWQGRVLSSPFFEPLLSAVGQVVLPVEVQEFRLLRPESVSCFPPFPYPTKEIIISLAIVDFRYQKLTTRS